MKLMATIGTVCLQERRVILFMKFHLMLVFLITTILFSITIDVQAATKKISGINRYATSAQIALDGWNRTYYAILVSGNNFPDALSAVPLTKKYFNAPILLTETNSIPTDTLNTIHN